MAKIITFSIYIDGKWTPQKIRDAKGDNMIKNGGWHFSYLGGYEMIIYKLKSFAHQEFNNEKYVNDRIIEKIKNGYDLFDRKGYRFIPVKIKKGNFPEYIVNNQDKYKHLIYQEINYLHNISVYITTFCYFILSTVKKNVVRFLGKNRYIDF